jgi:transcriptional regulator with XRE-family HTH domain
MTTISVPAEYTHGLGEAIRAHRQYMGITQTAMGRRFGMSRRDYQRLESGRDACPPGLLARIEQLSDEFARDVEAVLDEAEREGGVTLAVVTDDDPENEWQRLVAGRAYVETSEDAPITLVAADKPASVG